MKEDSMMMTLISLSMRRWWFPFILQNVLGKIPSWLTTRSTQMTSSLSASKTQGHFQDLSSVMITFGVLTKPTGMNL
jgi:hypothetical protein